MRLAVVFTLLVGCSSDPNREIEWQVVGPRHVPAALLSVWGTSDKDVYAVGGDIGDGRGPLVLHFDGTAWTRLDTGVTGNLWWVTGFAGGPVYMSGDGGTILRYEGGAFTRLTTPGTNTVFGMWGATPDEMWAVGGAAGGASGGFAWRLSGDTWSDAPGFPAEIAQTDAIWKMYGRTANDAWMVGTGKAVRWDGSSLTAVNSGTGESLFTVHANADRYVAVGGFGTGTIMENVVGEWQNANPEEASAPLIGVCMDARTQVGYAVGQEGAVLERTDQGWVAVDTKIAVEQAFHSVWIDPSGGVWAVGGQVQTLPLVNGVMLHGGAPVPELPK